MAKAPIPTSHPEPAPNTPPVPAPVAAPSRNFASCSWAKSSVPDLSGNRTRDIVAGKARTLELFDDHIGFCNSLSHKQITDFDMVILL